MIYGGQRVKLKLKFVSLILILITLRIKKISLVLLIHLRRQFYINEFKLLFFTNRKLSYIIWADNPLAKSRCLQ